MLQQEFNEFITPKFGKGDATFKETSSLEVSDEEHIPVEEFESVRSQVMVFFSLGPYVRFFRPVGGG